MNNNRKIDIYVGERETEYKYKMNEVIRYILSKEYGDTVYKEELANMLGFNIKDPREADKFKEKMCRIKNFLIDYGYILKTVNGIGYYILKPKQISGYVYHSYIMRLDKLLGKGGRILHHIDETELSDIRKEEKSNAIDLVGDLLTTTNTTIEQSAYYNKKNYYDSLDD